MMRNSFFAKFNIAHALIILIFVAFLSCISTNSFFSSTLWKVIHAGTYLVILITLACTLARNEKQFLLSNIKKILLIACALIVFFAFLSTRLDLFSSVFIKNAIIPLLFIVIFMGLGKHEALSPKNVRLVLKVIVLLGIISCIYNIVINWSEMLKIFTITNSYQVRFQSFFDNRNQFGSFMFTSIFAQIMLFYLDKEKNKRKLFRFLACLILFILNLLLTLSRGAILVSALFAFLTFFVLSYSSKRIRKKFAVVLVLLLVFAASIFIIPWSRDYILGNILRLDSFSTHRDDIYGYGLKYFINNNWIIGSGPEKALEDYENTYSYSGFHNSYLSVLIMFGIVGIVSYAIFLIYSFVNIRKLSVYDNIISSIFLAYLSSLVVYGLFETKLPFSYYYSMSYSVCAFILPLYVLNWYKDFIPVKKLPLVSVIIPTYNRPHTIERAIRSVYSQSYGNIEIVVVDDNAKNLNARKKTSEIMKKYPRVKYIKNQKNVGGAESRNIGIRTAKGKYVAFLDDDDEFLPSKISRQVALMEQMRKNKNIALVYCYLRPISVSSRKRFVKKTRNRKNTLYGHIMHFTAPTSTWLCDRKMLLKIGLFDDIKSQQDLMLMLKVLGNGYSIVAVPEALTRFYLHLPGNGITKNDDRFIEQIKSYQDECRKYYNSFSKNQIKRIEHNFLNRECNCYISRGDMKKAKTILGKMFRMRLFGVANYKNTIKIILYAAKSSFSCS